MVRHFASAIALFLAACAAPSPLEATNEASGASSEVGSTQVDALDIPRLLAHHVDFKNARGYDAFTLAEVPDTLVLVFRSQGSMNRHLGRASIFVEGTAPAFKGKIIPESAFDEGSYGYLIGGHDLEAPALCRFFGAAGDALWPEERVVRDLLVARGMLASGGDCSAARGTLLAQFDTLASEKYATYSHELLHAMFFNRPRLAGAATAFWRDGVTEAERAAIEERLGASYDTRDERLMANELLAYTFMAGGDARNALYDGAAALDRASVAARLRARVVAAGEADALLTLPALPDALLNPSADPSVREREGARWWIVERVGSRGVVRGDQLCVRALRSPSFNRQGDFKLDVERASSGGPPTITLLFDRNNLMGDNGLGSLDVCFDRAAHGLEGASEWTLRNEVVER